MHRRWRYWHRGTGLPESPPGTIQDCRRLVVANGGAAYWRTLLADLVRHVANARERELGIPASTTLADIRLSFEEAWHCDADGVVGPDGQF